MAASGTYKDPRTGVTTTQTHVTKPFVPRAKKVKPQTPDFSAGFTGAEAKKSGPRQMIASREIRYNRERRKAADAKGLESQKQSGQLQRTQMINRTTTANQAAQRKENKRAAGMLNRSSINRDAQQRKWDVQDRDIKAKQVRAAGTAKGRDGSLSDKNRYDMSIKYKEQVWDVNRPEEYYDWNSKKQAEYDKGMVPAFDNYLKEMGVGQAQQPVVKPTVQPAQPEEEGSGTYSVEGGQEIDVNTGFPVGGQSPAPNGSYFSPGYKGYKGPPVQPYPTMVQQTPELPPVRSKFFSGQDESFDTQAPLTPKRQIIDRGMFQPGAYGDVAHKREQSAVDKRWNQMYGMNNEYPVDADEYSVDTDFSFLRNDSLRGKSGLLSRGDFFK